MEHNKISKLLNHLTLSRSITRKWIKVNSKWFLSVNILSTKILDLYDYNDAYIVLKKQCIFGLMGIITCHKNVLYLMIMLHLVHAYTM